MAVKNHLAKFLTNSSLLQELKENRSDNRSSILSSPNASHIGSMLVVSKSSDCLFRKASVLDKQSYT
jgi:hypothetical protein